MPNLKGGKNYKKSKHTPAAGGRLVEAESDQMYGRVIKILGDRNMKIYCNDNATRICRVCGAMRKRVYVNLGDIVLISIRDLSNVAEKEKQEEMMEKLGMKGKPIAQREAERGDIIHKYQADELSKLKKVMGINEKLFLQLENVDGKVLVDLRKNDDDDYVGIEFAASSDDESEDSESDEEVKHDKRTKKEVKAKESKHARMNDEGPADNENDDIDIDDI